MTLAQQNPHERDDRHFGDQEPQSQFDRTQSADDITEALHSAVFNAHGLMVRRLGPARQAAQVSSALTRRNNLRSGIDPQMRINSLEAPCPC